MEDRPQELTARLQPIQYEPMAGSAMKLAGKLGDPEIATLIVARLMSTWPNAGDHCGYDWATCADCDQERLIPACDLLVFVHDGRPIQCRDCKWVAWIGLIHSWWKGC